MAPDQVTLLEADGFDTTQAPTGVPVEPAETAGVPVPSGRPVAPTEGDMRRGGIARQSQLGRRASRPRALRANGPAKHVVGYPNRKPLPFRRHSRTTSHRGVEALALNAQAGATGKGPLILTAGELLALKLPPREYLLEPWLRAKDLAMIFGYRGLGKTRIALAMAVAIAAGGKFLRWQAPRSRPVLYVDGELPTEVLQEMLDSTIRALKLDPGDNLRLLAADQQELGLPSLTEKSGQDLIEGARDRADLLILDNISTLCRGGEENAAEDWQSVQDFLLRLRRQGVSVLLVHHAGKNGGQRGTSKREDVLDSVISLERPRGYNPRDGLRVVVGFDKARGAYGQAVEPFEAQLRDDKAGPVWAIKLSRASTYDRVIALVGEGKTQGEIAAAIGRDKSRVSRIITKAKADGRL